MAQFNENFTLVSPNPLDIRYLSPRTSGGSQLPYSGVSEVISEITSYRYSGLTVLIRTGGTNVEYWFKNGVADADLIEKKYDSILPLADYVTGGTNLGFFSGYTGVQTLPIDHLLDSNYDGNYRSLYNYYYRGTDGKIHIGTPNDGIQKRGYVKTTPLPVTSWIWNEYTVDAQVGWMPIYGNIANQVGTFQPSVVYYPPSSAYTATSWTTGSAYNNGSNLVINTVLGSLTTGTTLTIGGPPFAFMEHNNLHFRTVMTQTPNTLAVSYTIVTGTDSVLTFRTLIGTGGTHIHTVGNYVYIDSSGGTSGGTNYNFIGSGATVVTQIGNNVYIYSPTGSTSGGVSEIITLPSHSFIAGEVIGFSGGTYNHAIADGTYNGEIIGLVSKYIDANTFELTQAGFVSGLTGLVSDTTYFLSPIVAGQLTATEPTTSGYISKAVLIATSTTSGWVLPYPGYYISSGVTLSWTNLADIPAWLSANTLNEFQTGHTHSYLNLTNQLGFIPSGGTILNLSGNSLTIYSPTGTSYTFTPSGGTLIGLSGNNVTIYSPTGTSLIFNNGLIQSGQTVSLGGTLTGNTTIGGAYNLNFTDSIIGGNMFCVNKGLVELGFDFFYGSDNTTYYWCGNNGLITTSEPAPGYTAATINQYLNFDYYPTTGTTYSCMGLQIVGITGTCIQLNDNSINFQALAGDLVNNAASINFQGYQVAYNSSLCYGYAALSAGTSATTYNVALGHYALSNNNAGCSNVAIGSNVLCANTSGSNNVGIGKNALRNNVAGTTNIGIGENSLCDNTTGYANVGIGWWTLQKMTNGISNVAIGPASMAYSTSGNCNIGIGVNTLISNNGGCFNNAIGNSALASNISGTGNVALGSSAIFANNNGNYNIGVGFNALYSNQFGCNNVAIGACALGGNSSGCSNVAIGNFAGCVLSNTSNKLYIANSASKTLIYGEFDTEKLCIRGKTYISGLTNSTNANAVFYNLATKELTYNTATPSGDKNNVYTMTTGGTGTTLLTTGSSYVILVNHVGGPATIILPTGATITQGLAYKIKDASYNANAYNITICSCTIPNRYIDDNSSTSALINTNGGAYELAYDQALNKWFTLAVVN
jgi:hypothetical protein